MSRESDRNALVVWLAFFYVLRYHEIMVLSCDIALLVQEALAPKMKVGSICKRLLLKDLRKLRLMA